MIKLKPFQNINEYDVLPGFAFTGTAQTKGALVTIAGSGMTNGVNPVRVARNNAAGVDHGNVYAPVYEVVAKVGLATSGTKPLGVLLFDVLDTKNISDTVAYLRYDKQRRDEAQCVLSGEGNVVVRAGILTVSGISGIAPYGTGTPTSNPTNSGVKVSDVNPGDWQVTTLTDSLSFGRILGQADKEGFVIVDTDFRK